MPFHCSGARNPGVKSIRKFIEKEQPAYCICGHFHETAGKQDKIVSVKQSEELFKKLKEHNLTSVLLELPWANHIFDFVMYGPGGQIVFEYMTQFLVWTLSAKKRRKSK